MSFHSQWSKIFSGLLMLSSVFAQKEMITIKFAELANYAIEHSPSMEIIEGRYGITKSDRSVDLEWTNPDFSYSQELSNDQLEHYVTLNKQFELPWIYSLRKQAWNNQVESAKFKKEQQVNRFISNLKHGYVELKLLETQLENLSQLKKLIEGISNVAADQFIEGSLSGIQQNLVQMTLISLNAQSQTMEQMAQSVKNRWKASLGLASSAGFLLATNIFFQPVELKTIDHYLTLIAKTPEYKEWAMKKLALQTRANLERGRMIPHFTLFGGSKRVEGNQGFVAGISIPLPVLNRNKAAVQKYKIQLEINESEFRLFEQTLLGEMTTLVLNIKNLGSWLESVDVYIGDDQDVAAGLMAAYEEGWMSLTEILNSIQIHADGGQKYYQQLNIYYRNIFDLEAITGKALVTFSTHEGDKQ